MRSRQFHCCLGLASLLLALGAVGDARAQAPAQPYPARPVKIVLSSPGGGTDIMARLVADHLSRRLGAQFIVESRQPNIAATTYVAKSPADGYTLLVATASYIVNTLLHQNPPYDPLRDFSTISQLGSTPVIVVVHPSLPVRTLTDLIRLAKANPDALNFGSGGIGSPLHLAGELFNQTAGVRIVHVPFRGTANAATDLQAGRVQVLYPSSASVLPLIKAGRIRAIAVMGARRSPELPDVPTTIESGLPKLVANIWYGMVAPRGTPGAIVDQLYQNVVNALQRNDIRERVIGLGVEPVGSSPSEFAAFAAEERSRWLNVIRTAKIEVAPQ
jgi:tripartite-type tricarboxylate transporter receptor subunit TctC